MASIILYALLSLTFIIVSAVFLKLCWNYAQDLIRKYESDLNEHYDPIFRYKKNIEDQFKNRESRKK